MVKIGTQIFRKCISFIDDTINTGSKALHSNPVSSVSKISSKSASYFSEKLQKCATREDFNALLKEYQQARMSGNCFDDLQAMFRAKGAEIKKVLNKNAKEYFSQKMATNPKYIFNQPIFKTQFNNFLTNTGCEYDLARRLLEDSVLGFKANGSAFIRILSSTNKNTSKYLNHYLNGNTIQRLESGKLVDLTADEIAHVFQFNRNNPNLNELLANPKKLTDFINKSNQIMSHAEKYRPDLASALKYNSVYKDNTWFNSSVNKNLLDDIESVIHGKSYYPKYNSSTSQTQILNETKFGDAIAIDGQMYFNNGKSLEKLAINETAYEKLFPPISRFDIRQSKITGDCFLVSPLEAAMNSPKGRGEIYRMFSQDTVGNLYVKTGGNKVATKVADLNPKAEELAGNNGLALIEREFATGRARVSTGAPSSMDAYDVFGKNCQILHHAFNPRDINNVLQKDFWNYINKNDHFIRIQFAMANPQYNILHNHAYSIKSYDEINKVFVITNPHRAGINISVPESELLQNICKLDVVKLI